MRDLLTSLRDTDPALYPVLAKRWRVTITNSVSPEAAISMMPGWSITNSVSPNQKPGPATCPNLGGCLFMVTSMRTRPEDIPQRQGLILA